MSGASTGQTLRCQSCGGAFSVPELTPRVACPYCGHQQAMETLYGRLEGYQQEVQAHLAAADQEYQRSSAWAHWSQGRAANPAKNMLVAYGLMGGIPMLLALGGVVAYKLGLFDGANKGGLNVVIMIASYLALPAYLLWYYGGRKKLQRSRASESLEETEVACPNCGAPGKLTPGEAIDSCAYCGAALVPSQTVMQQGLDAARAAHRKAVMDRHRVERRGMANVMSHAGTHTWKIIVLPTAGMFVITPLVFTFKMITGEEPFHPGILFLWAIIIAGGGAGLLYWRRRRAKKKAWRDALGDLARQFGGRLYTKMADWVEWLNVYWAGEFTVHHIYQGPLGCAAAVNACGYPGLVIADPTGADQYRPRRLEILIAAWIPGISDYSSSAVALAPAGERARAWLAQQGFQVELTEAGLHARADEATIKALHQDPAAAHELAPAVLALYHLATGAGAAPGEPIP